MLPHSWVVPVRHVALWWEGPPVGLVHGSRLCAGGFRVSPIITRTLECRAVSATPLPDEKTDIQRDAVTCSGHTARRWWSQKSKADWTDAQVLALKSGGTSWMSWGKGELGTYFLSDHFFLPVASPLGALSPSRLEITDLMQKHSLPALPSLVFTTWQPEGASEPWVRSCCAPAQNHPVASHQPQDVIRSLTVGPRIWRPLPRNRPPESLLLLL